MTLTLTLTIPLTLTLTLTLTERAAKVDHALEYRGVRGTGLAGQGAPLGQAEREEEDQGRRARREPRRTHGRLECA